MDPKWLKSFIRPLYGLVMIQPVVVVFLLLFYPHEWIDRYTTQAGPLQILITIWLVPIYHWYDEWWNLHNNFDSPQTISSCDD